MGCPEKIGGNFFCHNNQLTSLEGSPKWVGDNFDFSYNKLTLLVGIPDTIIGDINYSGNTIFELTSSWLQNNKKPDMYKVELFNDMDIIVGDKLYWSKLEYFHEEIGFPLPDMEKIKKYYTVIE